MEREVVGVKVEYLFKWVQNYSNLIYANLQGPASISFPINIM